MVDLPLPLAPTRQTRSPLPNPSEIPEKSGRPPNVTAASRSASCGGDAGMFSECCDMKSVDAAFLGDLVVGGIDGRELLVRQGHELLRQALGDQPVRMVVA